MSCLEKFVTEVLTFSFKRHKLWELAIPPPIFLGMVRTQVDMAAEHWSGRKVSNQNTRRFLVGICILILKSTLGLVSS